MDKMKNSIRFKEKEKFGGKHKNKLLIYKKL